MAVVVKLELPSGTKDLIRRAQVTLGSKSFRDVITLFFEREASRIAGAITKGKLSGQVLKRRTGSLARSIVGRGEIIDGLPGFRIGVLKGPAEPYAAVHEFGTVSKGGELPDIVPKQAKALAIPVGPALTPAGVSRFGNPRDQPFGTYQLIPFDNPGNGAFGGLYRTKDIEKEFQQAKRSNRDFDLSNVLAFYLLMRKVGVKPKRFLRDGFREELPKLVANLALVLSRMIALQSPKGAPK